MIMGSYGLLSRSLTGWIDLDIEDCWQGQRIINAIKDGSWH